MENSPPPPNLAANEESPSPPPPSKKPKLEDEEEETEGWFFGMKIESDLDSEEDSDEEKGKKSILKWTEEDKKVLRKLSDTDYDTDDDERNNYCARFTKEDLDAMAEDYINQTKTGGYDVVTFPPPNFPYACYYIPRTRFKEDKKEYRYAKEMAEFVIAHINTQFNDKSYCLVDVDKVVETPTFLTLLTFRAKELPAGSDADGDADAVIDTFQAKVHTPPPVYETYILEEWRFKPVSNAAEEDDHNNN